MMIPIPNINKAFVMLVSEESWRNLGKSAEGLDGIALFNNKGGMNQHRSFRFGPSGKK